MEVEVESCGRRAGLSHHHVSGSSGLYCNNRPPRTPHRPESCEYPNRILAPNHILHFVLVCVSLLFARFPRQRILSCTLKMASRGGLGCKAIDVKEPRLKRSETGKRRHHRTVDCVTDTCASRPSDVRFENERTARSVQHTQAPHCARPTVDGADLKPHSVNPSQSARPSSLLELQRYDPRYPGLLLQPDSRPISQEQLASEVKSIYAGLTIVETKCIHVDRAQAQVAANTNSQLGSEHWQALIALHRTLLHEHHDFFLAFQHASASPALRRLAKKYSMPARMWKHGIHSFLELLRQRIPDSIDYMLAFIYLAYQMMALLYETVPEFEDTWIECLGDLSRYRITIEDEDIRDRETWVSSQYHSLHFRKTLLANNIEAVQLLVLENSGR